MSRGEIPFTPEVLLNAYAQGYFPMAEDRDDPQIHWFYPEKRGVIPLDGFHVPATLKRFMKKSPFTITVDTAFPEVIRSCAETSPKRKETWINDAIIELYTTLWKCGHAHSVECWQDGKLVGGIYGVAMAGAFFGESMFSRKPNASKVALVTLLEMARDAGYVLFDTQYVNPHLVQFGVVEIARREYLKQLRDALRVKPEKCWD